MKILVLGATGFVGENLVNRLEEEGSNVVSCSKSLGVDILDYEQFSSFFREVKPDIVYNLASHGGSLHYVKEFAADVFTDNIQMALNMYKAVHAYAPSCKIIQPFSNCSYPGSSLVQHEGDWLNGPVHPSVFSFGNSKRAIYYLAQCYYEQYGVKTVNLMLPNTYGPGDSCNPNKTHALNGMIIRMLQAKAEGDTQFVVWGTGKPVREWAYIDDFIEVLVRAQTIDHMEYPVNVGQNKGYSIAESAALIKEASAYDGEIVFDTQYTDGDPVKIMGNELFLKTFPGFKFCAHNLGIQNTIAYYRDKL